MKVIKQNSNQGGDINVSMSVETGTISLKQYGLDRDLNWVICQKENTRELALSICPELAEEIERLKELLEKAVVNLPDNAVKAHLKSTIEQLKSK